MPEGLAIRQRSPTRLVFREESEFSPTDGTEYSLAAWNMKYVDLQKVHRNVRKYLKAGVVKLYKVTDQVVSQDTRHSYQSLRVLSPIYCARLSVRFGVDGEESALAVAHSVDIDGIERFLLRS